MSHEDLGQPEGEEQPKQESPGTDAASKGEVKERRGRPRTRLEDLEVGTETEGKVMATAKFGVFVDIGAVTDGLVHVSEFPTRRVRNVEDVVKQGDVVHVWIKEVDTNGNRISLSMRKKPTRPMGELAKGDVLSGTVTSVAKYGAFVEIGAETEGLVHISEMSSGYVEKPAEVVKVGEAVEVRVKEVDHQRERISLSMIGLANDMGLAPEQGQAPRETVAEEEYRPPTVVELALRKALGDEEDEAQEAEPGDEAEAAAEADRSSAQADKVRESLGEFYERMLAEYRESKSDG